ncbi:RNA-binding motif, single-stranded-interacting protein 1 [Liparis tanakae]|uniref:RNA-binding motif, single-stranded-interacting protein 1 n=1 Tax=Liparis tanakae TaxID=230148 RepID=A0A4Z2FGW0_9TELE|nr:RNA-binding motif, single-stranded-interacting protein 1 [Liparis tanakae]
MCDGSFRPPLDDSQGRFSGNSSSQIRPWRLAAHRQTDSPVTNETDNAEHGTGSERGLGGQFNENDDDTIQSGPRCDDGGYGFVDFDSPAAAQKAVSSLKATGVQAQMAKVTPPQDPAVRLTTG